MPGVLLGHNQLLYRGGTFTKKPLSPPSIEIYLEGTSCLGTNCLGDEFSSHCNWGPVVRGRVDLYSGQGLTVTVGPFEQHLEQEV